MGLVHVPSGSSLGTPEQWVAKGAEITRRRTSDGPAHATGTFCATAASDPESPKVVQRHPEDATHTYMYTVAQILYPVRRRGAHPRSIPPVPNPYDDSTYIYTYLSLYIYVWKLP